jgi:hypothetical protein
MGFFDKIKTQASNMGNAVENTVAQISGDTLTASKENVKIVAIKGEIASINGDLEIAYKEIGKKYVEHVASTGEYFEIGVKSTMTQIEPKLEKKEKLENELIEIEKMLKDQLLMQEKASFQREFDEEKSKLDKAYKMDVISEDDYKTRLAKAQLKLDNFEEIRRVKKQYEMDLITKNEMNMKLTALGV